MSTVRLLQFNARFGVSFFGFEIKLVNKGKKE
jgi:hypothetical protein